MKCKLFVNPQNYSQKHICIEGHCNLLSNRSLHKKLVGELEHLYICEQTGTPHLCGELCDGCYIISNSDSQEICEISGLVIRSTSFSNTQIEKKETIERPENLHNSVTKKKQKVINYLDNTEALLENCHNLPKNMDQSEVIKKIKLLKNVPLKECYLRVAIVRLAHIFSKERFQRDKEASLSFENELKKIIQKHISTVSRDPEQKLYTYHMLLLAHQHEEKKYSTPDMTVIKDNDLKILIKSYAYKCLYFWYIIRTQTKSGRENPGNFPWWEFIESALLIFRDGLTFPVGKNRAETVISRPDPFLRVLPDKSPFLIESSIGRKKAKRKTRTRIYNASKTALLEMMTGENKVNPEVFRFDNLNFNELDDNQFCKFRGSNRSN